MPKHYNENALDKMPNQEGSERSSGFLRLGSSKETRQQQRDDDVAIAIQTSNSTKKYVKSMRPSTRTSKSISMPMSNPSGRQEKTKMPSDKKAALKHKTNSTKGSGKTKKKTTREALENKKSTNTTSSSRSNANILRQGKKTSTGSERGKGRVRENILTHQHLGEKRNKPSQNHTSMKSGSFYRGNYRYSTTSLKGKKPREPRTTSIKQHTVQTNILDKATKAKVVQENAKKRDKRMVQTLKRRKKIDSDRVKSRQLNSGAVRQQRLKKVAREKRIRSVMISSWVMAIALGSRIQAAINMVQKFRQYREQVEIEDRAARIITRQMRLLKFQLYRKRVRGAIRVLSSVFLVKVRLWKNSRRRIASDRVRAFLVALEKENKESGGCLALIVKGKKWRAYRMKIIILQRLWRQQLRIISAQVLLIDRQWQQEQDRRTEIEVEKIYAEEEAKVIAENERIENINRTRKLIKLKPLPRKRRDNRDEIRVRLKEGKDLLSLHNIVPTEIRHELIRDMLKHLRCLHLNQLKSFDKAVQKYEDEMKDRQRRRAILVGFSGNGAVNSWVWGKSRSRPDMIELDHNNILPPSKPLFHIVLGEVALHTLMEIGKKYVEDLRRAWNPASMKIIALPYIAQEAANAHFKENTHLVATAVRNQSFL